MKHYVRLFLFTVWVGFYWLHAAGQEKQQPSKNIPPWISEKGYWVVETNLHTPGKSVVCFYKNDGTKVYEEPINGKPVNISKRKVLMRLKKALDISISSWDEKKPIRTNAGLLAALKK